MVVFNPLNLLMGWILKDGIWTYLRDHNLFHIKTLINAVLDVYSYSHVRTFDLLQCLCIMPQCLTASGGEKSGYHVAVPFVGFI